MACLFYIYLDMHNNVASVFLMYNNNVCEVFFPLQVQLHDRIILLIAPVSLFPVPVP